MPAVIYCRRGDEAAGMLGRLPWGAQGRLPWGAQGLRRAVGVGVMIRAGLWDAFWGCFKAVDLALCSGGIPSPVDGGARLAPCMCWQQCGADPGQRLLRLAGRAASPPAAGFFAACAAGLAPIPFYGSRPDPLNNFAGTVSPEAAPCQGTARIWEYHERWH